MVEKMIGGTTMLTKNEYEKIVILAGKYRRDQPDWRLGQCLFNAIRTINPALGEKITGGNHDTFYVVDSDTDKINKCWGYLISNIIH